MVLSLLTLAFGYYQTVDGIEHGEVSDVCFPSSCLQLFDGPGCSMADMPLLARLFAGGRAVGTIIASERGPMAASSSSAGPTTTSS
eukprot:5633850-Alexandrium_andersonii.AAC.1